MNSRGEHPIRLNKLDSLRNYSMVVNNDWYRLFPIIIIPKPLSGVSHWPWLTTITILTVLNHEYPLVESLPTMTIIIHIDIFIRVADLIRLLQNSTAFTSSWPAISTTGPAQRRKDSRDNPCENEHPGLASAPWTSHHATAENSWLAAWPLKNIRVNQVPKFESGPNPHFRGWRHDSNVMTLYVCVCAKNQDALAQKKKQQEGPNTWWIVCHT